MPDDPIHVRMPDKLLEDMDDFIESSPDFDTRSQFVRSAIRSKLSQTGYEGYG